MSFCISVGARASALSQKQVQEVLEELSIFYPEVTFHCHWMQTSGDKDLRTSLRGMENSDFFTKEITEAQIQGDQIQARIRISIHSAKDLPDPLPKGLCLAALTKGKNPKDSLVLPKGKTLQNLGIRPKIGTSSKRREIEVKKLIPNAEFIDIRGTIEQRLQLLSTNVVDALVIAEAAILRLDLGFLHRIQLEGEVTKYQGQLAVLARDNDLEMLTLFSCLDTRDTYEETPVFWP